MKPRKCSVRFLTLLSSGCPARGLPSRRRASHRPSSSGSMLLAGIVCAALVLAGVLLAPAVTCFAQCPEDSCNTNCKKSSTSSSWATWAAFGYNWPESIMPIDYYINKDGAANCVGDEFKAVQRSLANWEELMTTYWSGCYQGTTSAHSSAHASPSWDSLNVVSWEDMGSGTPRKLGKAAYWYISGLIQEADISLNDNAVVMWSALTADSCFADTTYDLESVTTHEFGHWMSMQHSCDTKATMYCWTSKNQTHERTPNGCDILGMQWNYTQYTAHPKIQPGCWPAEIGYWVTSNPALGDINRDGVEDVVIVGNDGKVHVLSGRGHELYVWPEPVGDEVTGSPALGDIDGDGWLEIVVGSHTDSVYVFNSNGSRAANWPNGTDGDVQSTPAIGDIDQDDCLDVVCASRDSCVYAWSGSDGSSIPGWPVKLGGDIPLAGPALADLDGDDSLDVVISGYDYKVYALSPHGIDLAGWPVSTGEKVYERVAVGDIDDDSDFEVVATAVSDSAYAWNTDGSRCSGWPVYVPGSIGYSAPSLGDIDGDGVIEVLFGSDSDSVYAFEGNGGRVTGWPVYVDGKVRGSVLIVDVDGDDAYEAVAATDNSKVYAFDGNGNGLTYWPATFDGGYERTPVIGDCNGDGELDIVMGSGGSKVYAYCLGTALRDNSYEWRMYGNDFHRTSRYGFAPNPPTPLRFLDHVADFTHWERFGIGASINLSTMSYSPPTSMGITGSPIPGDFASAYSEFITVDFSRPYTIKFAFAYDDFFSSTWIVFGHARFRLDTPFSPVLLDIAGDWSSLVPVGPPFNNYTPPMAYAEYEIQVEPTTRNIQLLVNGTPAGGATYGPGVVPSNRMWLSDDPNSSEFLTGWYDDFEVRGYLPIVSVKPRESVRPRLVNALHQSYPNPMNPVATIRYSVRESGRVTIKIFDVAGRVIRELVDEVKQASSTPYSVVWDGRDDSGRRVASGVYFYRMDTKKFASSKKIVVLQ